MARWIKKARHVPTIKCGVSQYVTPYELRYGTVCERDYTNNEIPPTSDGYIDGYNVCFVPEGEECEPSCGTSSSTIKTTDKCPASSDLRGYHKYTTAEYFNNQTVDGKCVSPYGRKILGSGGYASISTSRESMLLDTTGKPVILLRRQYVGPQCPCYSVNRGRAKGRCPVCFNTGIAGGYVPYINSSDPLGRIMVRFEPYEEKVSASEQGYMQDVQASAWTLPHPILRQRDIIIVYNLDGSEEFRWEIMSVTRNDTFLGESGAQKFQVRRIDPTDVVYTYDPLKVPDLEDIIIDVSDNSIDEDDPRFYDELGKSDDGDFPNIVIEAAYGDGAFSSLFTTGYKEGYEYNYSRGLKYYPPLVIPDFDENGFLLITDGYGPTFQSVAGKAIHFDTPQDIADNSGTNPLEVIAAEKKRNYLKGWGCGCKAGYEDVVNYLRRRGEEL